MAVDRCVLVAEAVRDLEAIDELQDKCGDAKREAHNALHALVKVRVPDGIELSWCRYCWHRCLVKVGTCDG